MKASPMPRTASDCCCRRLGESWRYCLLLHRSRRSPSRHTKSLRTAHTSNGAWVVLCRCLGCPVVAGGKLYQRLLTRQVLDFGSSLVLLVAGRSFARRGARRGVGPGFRWGETFRAKVKGIRSAVCANSPYLHLRYANDIPLFFRLTFAFCSPNVSPRTVCRTQRPRHRRAHWTSEVPLPWP